MKSTTRATGQPGGLALGDTLSNVASGMGTSSDKAFYNRWHLGSGAYGSAIIDYAQIEAAYRTSWLVRKIHDIPPEEMTKAWREWSAKPEEIKKIEDEEKRLDLRSKVQFALIMARLVGGSALILGLPGNPEEPAPKTIRAGELQYVHSVSRYQLIVTELDLDLLSPNFGLPTSYGLSGGANSVANIHPSRVITFHGAPVPRTMGVAATIDQFWGAPLMESLNEAMQQATVALAGVNALLVEAKTDVISVPNLTDQVSTAEGVTRLQRRFQTAATMKSLFNILMLDAGNGSEGSGESWETKQIRFTTLPDVVQTFLQVAAGAADIPLTRLIGAPPKGLNATGEHDENNFLSMIRSRQNTTLRPALERLDPYLIASAFGSARTDLEWTFCDLKEMTEAEQADIDNVTADTFDIIKQTGLIPLDALAKVQVAVMEATDRFPGLAEAVDASIEDIPAMAQAEQAAATAEAAIKEPAAGDATRLPAARGAKASVRRAANDSMLDAAPRSLYVSRKVMNPQELLKWARAAGIPNLQAAGELHVTVVFSRQEVDWLKIPADWNSAADGRLRIPPGGARVIERLGPEAVVLSFASDMLTWRHEAMLSAGATSDYEGYTPHVTLSWDVPQDFDLSAVQPYTGRIVLGPEIFKQVVEDWRISRGGAAEPDIDDDQD